MFILMIGVELPCFDAFAMVLSEDALCLITVPSILKVA